MSVEAGRFVDDEEVIVFGEEARQHVGMKAEKGGLSMQVEQPRVDGCQPQKLSRGRGRGRARGEQGASKSGGRGRLNYQKDQAPFQTTQSPSRKLVIA